MEPSIQISRAERAGGALGLLWKKCARLDRKWCDWLIARGLPAGLVKSVLWIAKLVVLGVLFYAVFWLALMLVIALAVAGIARNADWDNEELAQTEWRNGAFGFGLYHPDGSRIDPHDPDDEL